MTIVYWAEVTDPTSEEPVVFEAASEAELEAQLPALSGEAEAPLFLGGLLPALHRWRLRRRVRSQLGLAGGNPARDRTKLSSDGAGRFTSQPGTP